MSEPASLRCSRSASLVHGTCFLACVAFAAVTFVHLHDRTWNAYDDGTYLHVADRILHGEVLHRDVQDMHPGYINFANAAAMWLFGNDAVSPRYFLVAMGVINGAVAYWLLAGAGASYAAAASVAVTALSFGQFMNPTAHWYCLSLALLTGAAMARLPAPAARTQVLLGLLVGAVVLFRQLTGVFVAMAVLLHVLLALPRAPQRRPGWLGKALLVVTALGLSGYVLRNADPVAFVMYGALPTAVLLWAAWRVRAADRDVLGALLRLSAGGAIAALPLVAYNVYHGTVRAWLDDCVFGALSITRLPFYDLFRYWHNILGGAKAVLRHEGVASVLTGMFWVAAPAIPILLAALVLAAFRRTPATAGGGGEDGSAGVDGPYAASGVAGVSPLALLGMLYFPVALHLQKYMYFFFAVPVAVVGLLAITPALRRPLRLAVLGTVWALAAVAYVLFDAPIRRLVPGPLPELVANHGVPRCGILLSRNQVAVYNDVLGLIERESAKDDSIFAVPVSPELYYLSGRRNPTRFYLTAIALRRPEDVRSLLDQFEQSPPKLVFHNPRSGYNNLASRQVMDWVRSRYEPLGDHGGFEVYRRSAPAAPASPDAGQ